MRNEPTGASRQLNRLFRLGTVGGMTDSQLLEQFVSGDQEEILEEWPERTSWRTQPRYEAEPAATCKFEPGDGWKLIDVTPLVRARAKAGRNGHGVVLRFLNEDVSGVFSDYKLVSHEATAEWADRRPVLLVVKSSKPAKTPSH
jgi:hypothetical protein